MSGYFNIFHFIAIGILTSITVLLLYLVRKEQNIKNLISMIVAILCVMSIFGFMAMITIDLYTKSAVLENVTSQRVLRNETIVFRGTVRNTGISSVANCDIVIKLINNPTTIDDLKGENLFRPSGWSIFSWFGNNKTNDRSKTVEYKISIAKNLKPKEFKSFYVSMPYPPYFTKTQTITKIECR